MTDKEYMMTEKPKILIVDDQVANLVALERLLVDVDAELIRAGSGNEALALTLLHEFALALIDVQMPGMDGFEVVELLRLEKRTAFLPVIFVSAVYSGEYYKIRGVEAGAVDFVEKPVVPEILRGKVRIFLDAHNNALLLEKARKELTRREKMAAVGSLAGGVAHDLRNPFNVISNSVYFLNMQIERFNSEKVKKHLKIIQREIDRATAITGDLLSFAEIPSPRCIDCDINAVLHEALHSIVLPESIALDLQLEKNPPSLSVDPDQLCEVFMRILDNSCQAMPQGGRLTVKSVFVDDTAAISFQDSGVGISPHHISKIYEPLFTAKAKGIGLGLAIVRELVQRMNGRIAVQSEIGTGTIFTLFFPLQKVDGEMVKKDRGLESV